MNRFGAFAVHLGISLIIFIILGYIILFHWYPDFFFASDGGWQGIRIVAFVDLVLGPVLTLVVFNQAKPRRELRRDLTIIGLIQAVCLTAGTWVVYSERPIAMVFLDGSFQSLTTDDYIEAGQSVPNFESTPAWVSVRLPEDLAAQGNIRRQALAEKRPLKTLADYYAPFSTIHIDVQQHGISRFEMERIGMSVFEAFVEAHGGRLDDYVFLPFGTRYVPALMVYGIDSDELIYLGLPLQLANETAGN